MSKRVRLYVDMSSAQVDVGWAELTLAGDILEIHVTDPVARMTHSGERTETRCKACADDVCLRAPVIEEDCLCCKKWHGRKNLEV